MGLDPSFTGRTYPPTEPYTVGREKIREFAGAIGAREAVFHDPDVAKAAGHLDVIAPPTFAVVLTALAGQQLIDDPELGLDFSRVVHGDQRFAYRRAIRAGDRLVCVTTIEEIMSRAGNDFITSRTDVTTEDGEPVVAVWSKLVVRGATGERDHGGATGERDHRDGES